MIRHLKALLLSFFVLLVIGSLLLFLSLRSEENHLENCKSLGIVCDPGKIHEATRELWLKIQPLLQRK